MNLLLVLRGVVRATRGAQAISARSPRLLVVTGQRLGDVPVDDKSEEVSARQLKRKTTDQQGRDFVPSPDVLLIHPHTKADGRHDNQHLPLHPLLLHLRAISGL